MSTPTGETVEPLTYDERRLITDAAHHHVEGQTIISAFPTTTVAQLMAQLAQLDPAMPVSAPIWGGDYVEAATLYVEDGHLVVAGDDETAARTAEA